MTTLLRIEPAKEGKGRSFSGHLLAWARADSLWAGGVHDPDTYRPVWAMIATSEAESRPVVANLIGGRKAELGDAGWRRRGGPKLELLKSAGYRIEHARHAEGVVTTFYLPELFRADGCLVDPQRVAFVMLPSRAWAEAQDLPRNAIMRYMTKLYPDFDADKLRAAIPYGVLFGVRLDRLTRAPLVADPRFYVQVMFACLREGLATWSVGRDEFGRHGKHGFKTDLGDVGIDDIGAVACNAQQEDVERLLAEEVETYFNMKVAHGTNR